MVEALLVIHIEGGGPLVVEGRQALPLTSLLAQLDAAANHVRNGEPGTDFIEKGGRKTHQAEETRTAPRCKRMRRGGRSKRTAHGQAEGTGFNRMEMPVRYAPQGLTGNAGGIEIVDLPGWLIHQVQDIE